MHLLDSLHLVALVLCVATIVCYSCVIPVTLDDLELRDRREKLGDCASSPIGGL